MTESLADQLKKVKLKKSAEPMKDFSNPKTMGFTSAKEIREYEDKVLDVNTERWIQLLSDVTFPTVTCPFTLDDAKLFIECYKRIFDNKDAETAMAIDWKASLVSVEREHVANLTERLDSAMSVFTKDDGCAFVKLSSRSAKDAPMLQSRLKDMYRQALGKFNETEQKQENTKIICLLQAAFDAMRVTCAADVIDMFVRSERVYQDLLLAAINRPEVYDEHFVIRKFIPIDVDMEFRGFVYQGQLTALSQYNYMVYSERLVAKKDSIANRIQDFFKISVQPKLPSANFPQDFIIDFAVCDVEAEDNLWKLWVIELNPFLSSTDGAMFSWEHERHLLTENDGFHFRVVPRPKPGSLTMLPSSVRAILKDTMS
ncbi:cell division cycle protein 123-like [Mizuhopecten yessoensis]|uniref:Cell division cycle protein 123 n=1 Tax=Mizuhopecten yessoensis TaxID=6573 RepID=A0A210Q9A8_MIZYE|nr:cell division cycle protein 123-like [Mizuhopecten yessoensis]XP_021364023.1 cell division cycle protein 123-like [Mizuhopecten yessoensis]OWF45332.1 Cell division cycle protein 123 [Mizuhopecten yessoensis]